MLASIILFVHWIITSALAIRIISRRLPVGSSLAWLSLVFFLPIIGITIYLLIGEASLGRRRLQQLKSISEFYRQFLDKNVPDLESFNAKLDPSLKGISDAAASNTIFTPFEGNNLSIVDNTDDIFNAIIADINSAEHNCALEFYIIDPQGRAIDVLETLIKARQRGVKCVLMADAIGSSQFFKSDWPIKLKQSGIDIIDTLPVSLFKSFLIRGDLRNHRKIIIIDSSVAYTGSFNLIDPKYFKQTSGVGQWVDAVVRCQGPIVQSLSAVCYADIFIEHKKDLKEEITKHQKEQPDQFKLIKHGEMKAQVIASGPDQHHYVIYESLISLMYSANKSLVITTPYFVPDESILLAITHAARRGVDVTLLLPKEIDSFLVRYASYSHFQSLLDAGVKIALYNKGLLHTKSLLIDNEYALFGTANIDMRSFYLNLEVSLIIFDKSFSMQLSNLLKSYLKDSDYVDKEKWQTRSVYKQFLENLLRLSGPLL